MAAHSHFGLRFPHYEEIMQPVSEEELKCFKNDVKRGESFISMFNYALSLGRSEDPANHEAAMLLFAGLENEQDKAYDVGDLAYYKAMVAYKMKNYSKAKEYLKVVLSKFPDDEQALQFSEELNKKLYWDGIKGFWITGAITAVGAIAVSLLTRRR